MCRVYYAVTVVTVQQKKIKKKVFPYSGVYIVRVILRFRLVSYLGISEQPLGCFLPEIMLRSVH